MAFGGGEREGREGHEDGLAMGAATFLSPTASHSQKAKPLRLWDAVGDRNVAAPIRAHRATSPCSRIGNNFERCSVCQSLCRTSAAPLCNCKVRSRTSAASTGSCQPRCRMSAAPTCSCQSQCRMSAAPTCSCQSRCRMSAAPTCNCKLRCRMSAAFHSW